MTTTTCRKADFAADRDSIFSIREQVFVIGQNVPPEEELDGLDDCADHFLAEIDGVPVATTRVRFPEGGLAKIERVAVLESCQGRGIGRELMQFILGELKKQPHLHTAKLSSQEHAIPFYEKLGFTALGKPHMDANIPHDWMVLDLKQ